MSRDDTHFSDAWLAEAVRHADPSEQDTARTLAGVERRLGIAGGGSTAEPVRQLRPASTPQPRAAAAGAQLARAARSGKSAAAFGRWLAISATGALLGYLGGRAESHREIALLEQQTHEQAQRLEQQEEAARQATRRQESAPLDEARPPAQTPDDPQPLERLPQPPAAPLRATHPTPARHAPHLVRKAQPPAVSPPAVANPALRQAIELLQRAEAQLRAGDAFAASLLLSDLDRSAGPDLLREERLVTRALVSCALGEVKPARAALHDLELLDPQSIYRARLEGSCAEKMQTDVPKAASSPH